MKMRLQDGKIQVIEADEVQKAIIKSWNRMRYIRGHQMYEGPASLELLNKLAGICRLPAYMEEERVRMNRVQDAVDKERTRKDPKPMVRYPVSRDLYEHQVRAANMALITFGIILPMEDTDGKEK